MTIGPSIIRPASSVDPKPISTDPLVWLASVLTSFADAEQALGRLSVALGYRIEHGSLGNLQSVRDILSSSDDRRLRNFERRIARWLGNRPIRNLLAHATVKQVFDTSGQPFIVTRHLPRDSADVTPDRVWSENECEAFLRDVRKDSQSIRHHVSNLFANPARLSALKAK
ncbi:hypothetical protein [Pontixanthobacter sp.]|uniref:hypothetical protein n=1 Tax=Pontixanthobacter sp. TaxID=2792078 RepID=UPI003C7B2B2F